MSSTESNSQAAPSSDRQTTYHATCRARELLDQGATFQPGVDPHDTRSGVYKVFETTHSRLLGDFRASHRADLRRAGWPIER